MNLTTTLMGKTTNWKRESRQRKGTRWILATLLALLLVITAVHYRSLARRVLLARAATELAEDGVRLNRLIESNRITRPRDLEAAFGQIRQESWLSIMWIQLRGADGAVQARAGVEADPVVPVNL